MFPIVVAIAAIAWVSVLEGMGDDLRDDRATGNLDLSSNVLWIALLVGWGVGGAAAVAARLLLFAAVSVGGRLAAARPGRTTRWLSIHEPPSHAWVVATVCLAGAALALSARVFAVWWYESTDARWWVEAGECPASSCTSGDVLGAWYAFGAVALSAAFLSSVATIAGTTVRSSAVPESAAEAGVVRASSDA